MKYDLAIIGWGAAGFASAIRASELTFKSARIALIGRGPVGGTCVNVGCVPSKILLSIADQLHGMKKPENKLIHGVYPEIEKENIFSYIREIIKNEQKSKYSDVLKNYENIDVFQGDARFLSGNEIDVSGTGIEFYNSIISTGSRPHVPENIKIGGNVVTSDTIWDLNDIPESVVIWGSGSISVEIGQALSRLGCAVTIVARSDRILKKASPDFSKIMEDILIKDGIRILKNSSVEKYEERDGMIKINLHDGTEIRAEKLLVATGRIPNISDLGLENAGVLYKKDGIFVDSQLRTSNPRIYAAGDCVYGSPQLETASASMGSIAANNIYGDEIKEYVRERYPLAVFTDPAYVFCGKRTEDRVETAISNVSKSRIVGRTEGKISIYLDRDERVKGMEVIAYHAEEFSGEISFITNEGKKLQDIIDMPHVFPTFSESIKICAQSRYRDPSMGSCCVE